MGLKPLKTVYAVYWMNYKEMIDMTSKTKCSNIVRFFERISPSKLAEDWDNVGLLVGSFEKVINKAMLCLDVTSKVVDEAVKNNVDIIISHHPLIFKGLKRINKEDFKGSIIYRLIQNDISVYSAHTNLDAASDGVNYQLAKALELDEITDLEDYKYEKLYKIAVFVPEESLDSVRDAMTNEGAGFIGKYSSCTFASMGKGTFKAMEGAIPYIGDIGKFEEVNEIRLETIVEETRLKKVIAAMINAHPYEEVAYDVYLEELKGKKYGLGKIGLLKETKDINTFALDVKNKLNTPNVRVIGSKDNIKKVAVYCGSFDDKLLHKLKTVADIIVTGDIKYHAAVDMLEMGICAIDAGHFATEAQVLEILKEKLADEFLDIDINVSAYMEDPFKVI